MKVLSKITSYFSKFELGLWGVSITFILISFLAFDRANYLTLIASLIGATSLIFGAKGNPISQALMIIFSVLYGIISYSFRYYGEMITYIGMTLPMATLSLISWIKNPHKGNRAEVQTNSISKFETCVALTVTLVVTVGFYIILKYFNTANLLPSTLSVTTSFLAAYLTMRRSPYFCLVYALNDGVLIVLWALATMQNLAYMSVIVCFIVFFVNDLYAFVSWSKMQKRQKEE